LIEALACGAIPVVADIPTFRRLTKDGALGALWPPGSADAFVQALRDAQARDAASLRTAIARHFEAELSWAAIGRRALAIYEDVARQGS
jgi:glycosyltransferase involved in cell wall biosynthesis